MEDIRVELTDEIERCLNYRGPDVFLSLVASIFFSRAQRAGEGRSQAWSHLAHDISSIASNVDKVLS